MQSDRRVSKNTTCCDYPEPGFKGFWVGGVGGLFNLQVQRGSHSYRHYHKGFVDIGSSSIILIELSVHSPHRCELFFLTEMFIIGLSPSVAAQL